MAAAAELDAATRWDPTTAACNEAAIGTVPNEPESVDELVGAPAPELSDTAVVPWSRLECAPAT